MKEIREFKETYRNIIDSIEEGLIIFNSALIVKMVNQSAEKILGVSKSRLNGMKLSDLFGDNKIHNLAEEVNFTGKGFYNIDTKIKKKYGEVCYASISISPLIDDDGSLKGILVKIIDQSKIKELEEEVKRSDRLSTFGIIAAGMAHEIKNPLGALKGAAQLILRGLKDNPELKTYADIIVKESERINFLLEDILNLSSPKKLSLTVTNIHRILDYVLALHQEEFSKEKIKLIKEYDPSIPEILLDENKFKQVFLNLIKNAVESIYSDGTILISTRIETDYFIQTEESKKSKYIAISVSDTGYGIEENELQKIFVPFFTTKSKGTGLGLAISHKIVKDHNGSIRVTSTPGKGTTFTVSLPVNQNYPI